MTVRSASRAAGFVWIVAAYGVATAAALAAAAWLVPRLPLWQTVGLADVLATIVVFAFSVALDNSSVYDPYWSVAPMVIAPALSMLDSAAQAPLARRVAVLALVLAWGTRLTFNWARGWQGLGHEDWRYAEYRKSRGYWVVSFLGFHLMPTVWVYLGCLSLLPAFASPRALSALDVLGLLITAGAIALETTADEQLRTFRLANPEPGKVLDSGVWALCRHPNYLGELSFWWGVYLFGLAADPRPSWTLAGPVSITMLFVFVSTPLLDRRSLVRRPGYEAHMAKVPALFPRFFGHRA